MGLGLGLACCCCPCNCLKLNLDVTISGMIDGPNCGAPHPDLSIDCSGGPSCGVVNGTYTLTGGCCSWNYVAVMPSPCHRPDPYDNSLLLLSVSITYDRTTNESTVSFGGLLDSDPCGAGFSGSRTLPGRLACADLDGLTFTGPGGGITGPCQFYCECDATAVVVKIGSAH